MMELVCMAMIWLALANIVLGLPTASSSTTTNRSTSNPWVSVPSSTLSQPMSPLDFSNAFFNPTTIDRRIFSGQLKCNGQGETFAGVLSDVREFCRDKAGVDFAGTITGMVWGKYLHADLEVISQSDSDDSRTFSESDCLNNMIYILWSCPSNHGQAPGGTFTSDSGFTWVINLNMISKRAAKRSPSASVIPARAATDSILRCTPPGQTSFTDIENDVRDFCSSHAGDAFEYLTQTEYQHGSVGVYQYCGFLGIKETFTEQTCLDNMLRILHECPTGDGVSPRGALITDSDCLSWVVSAAESILDKEPSIKTTSGISPAELSASTLSRRQTASCDEAALWPYLQVNFDAWAFCSENAGVAIDPSTSATYASGTYGVSACDEGRDWESVPLSGGDCRAAMQNIMDACRAFDCGPVYGGSFTDGDKCLVYYYGLDTSIKREKRIEAASDADIQVKRDSALDLYAPSCHDNAPSQEWNHVLYNVFAFCLKYENVPVVDLLSYQPADGAYGVRTSDGSSPNLTMSDCYTGFMDIMTACGAPDHKVYGGGYILPHTTLTFEYDFLQQTDAREANDVTIAPRRRQAIHVSCSGDRDVASGVAVQTATDSFCHTFNGWTLKRNNTISERVTVSPVAKDGSCLKANVSITNSCFEFFTWYKPCEASFDDIMADCDNGNTETSGGVETAGDNGCVQYKIGVYTAEDER